MLIQSWGKSGVLAYFWLKICYFGHIFWDMDFKFVKPIIYINIKGHPNKKSIGLKLTIFWSSKNQKMAISKNAILAKCQSPKSLLLYL